jgi:malate dehydrogenase (oxaloacetate-decarboxylating)(NADP+)
MLQTTSTQSGTPAGMAVLNDPALNKGTAFTAQERSRYGLEGLLPHAVESLDRQVERVLGHLSAKATDLERYIYLIGLEDRNETLFYQLGFVDEKTFDRVVDPAKMVKPYVATAL